MRIINESQPEYRKKIGCFLQTCAPNPGIMNIEELNKLDPLNIRDLAWMVAICETQVLYGAIPWEDQLLRERVEVLHNIFLNKVEEDINGHADGHEFEALSLDVKTDAIHKLMGIKWELTHNYNALAISTYFISLDHTSKKLNTLVERLLSAIGGKIVAPIYEPVQMLPHIRQGNKEARSYQVIRLLSTICDENPLKIDVQKISSSIQSFNLAWAIAICQKGWQSIAQVDLKDLGLTPLVEIINEKIMDKLQANNQLHGLKVKCLDEVDLRGSDCVKKILTYELPPEVAIFIINSILNKTDESLQDLEEIIDRRLGASLEKNIKECNPSYSGLIWSKTSAPHALIITVMCIMRELQISKITWATVKSFIEEHIWGNSERQNKIRLEDIDDYCFTVDGVTVEKINCQKSVSEYKKTILISSPPEIK